MARAEAVGTRCRVLPPDASPHCLDVLVSPRAVQRRLGVAAQISPGRPSCRPRASFTARSAARRNECVALVAGKRREGCSALVLLMVFCAKRNRCLLRRATPEAFMSTLGGDPRRVSKSCITGRGGIGTQL